MRWEGIFALWNKRKRFDKTDLIPPRNMLFTLMLAVSADFVKHKGKLAWKQSLTPRRMRQSTVTFAISVDFVKERRTLARSWRDLNFPISMANIFLLSIQNNSKLVKMFTGAIKASQSRKKKEKRKKKILRFKVLKLKNVDNNNNFI